MFATAQSLLACVMLSIVCLLAALYVSTHLCNPKPKTTSDYLCHAGVILLFVLVFIHLCRCVRMSDKTSVQAETFQQKTGCFAHDNTASTYAPFKKEHTRRIVGPNPDSKGLNTWQYNPQNTLVNYSFYETGNHSTPSQLAPVIDGSIGKTTTTNYNTQCESDTDTSSRKTVEIKWAYGYDGAEENKNN